MIKRFFFFCSFLFVLDVFCALLPLSEEEETVTEELKETSQEPFFNEEEEISAVPKKGNRPQVIHLPPKTPL